MSMLAVATVLFWIATELEDMAHEEGLNDPPQLTFRSAKAARILFGKETAETLQTAQQGWRVLRNPK